MFMLFNKFSNLCVKEIGRVYVRWLKLLNKIGWFVCGKLVILSFVWKSMFVIVFVYSLDFCFYFNFFNFLYIRDFKILL